MMVASSRRMSGPAGWLDDLGYVLFCEVIDAVLDLAAGPGQRDLPRR